MALAAKAQWKKTHAKLSSRTASVPMDKGIVEVIGCGSLQRSEFALESPWPHLLQFQPESTSLQRHSAVSGLRRRYLAATCARLSSSFRASAGSGRVLASDRIDILGKLFDRQFHRFPLLPQVI
jgi:hypothetical protein